MSAPPLYPQSYDMVIMTWHFVHAVLSCLMQQFTKRTNNSKNSDHTKQPLQHYSAMYSYNIEIKQD